MTILETLVKLQEEHNLNNLEMANKLSLTRISWWRIRRGRQPVSADVRFKAAIAFPEKQDIFLSTEYHFSNSTPVGEGE